MKIHIVQKGDTLWKIAKKYGVNFEELKKMNSHLSNPDMIMPGMKIRVPSEGVPVKKEAPISKAVKEAPTKQPVKEAPKAVHPYAEMPPVTLPVVEEAKEMPKAVLPETFAPPPAQPPYMPIQQIYHPQPEIDVNNFYINMANMGMMNQAPPPLPPKPENILPGMMKPEEEIPEKVELPEKEELPEMEKPAPPPPVFHQPICPPLYQQPCMPPCPPPPCCHPATPVMPGAGFMWPMQQPYGYQAGYGQAMNPMGVNPAMAQMPDFDDPDDLENPESINFNYPDDQGSSQFDPQMMGGDEGGNPQMSYMPNLQNCVPTSPVLPGSGFGGFGYQPFASYPQTAAMPGIYMQPSGFGPTMPQTFGGYPWFNQPPFMPQSFQMPFGAVQGGYPMYPYGYQRQDYPYYQMPDDDDSDEYDY